MRGRPSTTTGASTGMSRISGWRSSSRASRSRVDEQPDDELAGLEAAHRAELAVGLDRGDERLEGLDEPRVTEVVEALAGDRLGAQLRRVEGLVGTDPHRVVELEEPLGQLGLGQVVDADGLGHRPILTESGAPRPRASRPAPAATASGVGRAHDRPLAGRQVAHGDEGARPRRGRARPSRRRRSPPRPDQRPARPRRPTRRAATSAVVSSARHGVFGGVGRPHRRAVLREEPRHRGHEAVSPGAARSTSAIAAVEWSW